NLTRHQVHQLDLSGAGRKNRGGGKEAKNFGWSFWVHGWSFARGSPVRLQESRAMTKRLHGPSRSGMAKYLPADGPNLAKAIALSQNSAILPAWGLHGPPAIMPVLSHLWKSRPMSEARSTRIRRLIYQSSYTGMKETDLLLGRFAQDHLAGLDDEALDHYEALLAAGDGQIYLWVSGAEPVPPHHDTAVLELIKKFRNE
ncbi:MAG: succinate dehydrogenase assembly factor 2, partial [Candidatus Puniceispirillaceae bacterium]